MRVVAQEVRNRLGVVATELGSDGVNTILSILTREPRKVESAHEPVRWLFTGKGGQRGHELVVATTTINSCIGPVFPLLFPLLFI